MGQRWGYWNNANSMTVVNGRKAEMKALQVVLAKSNESGYKTLLFPCVGGENIRCHFGLNQQLHVDLAIYLSSGIQVAMNPTL